MLPKIDKTKRFSSSFDRCDYYNKKIKEFLNINRNINEAVNKYNYEAVGLFNELVANYVNPVVVKFAIVGNLALHTDNISEFRKHLTIVRSLKSQRTFIYTLKSTVKRTRIDSDWLNIFYKYVIVSTKTRCDRLSKDILPALIESTELYVYLMYLKDKGIDFKDDIAQVASLDFNGDEFKEYCDNIAKTSNEYFKTLPKEEQERILAIRKHNRDVNNKRRTAIQEEKNLNKINKIKSSYNEIYEMLSIYCQKEVDNFFIDNVGNSNLSRLYNIIDDKVKQYGYSNILNDEFIFLAFHIKKNNGFSKSSVKYIKKNGVDFTSGLTTACVFMSNLEANKIKSLMDKYSDKYIICDININRAKSYIENNNNIRKYSNINSLDKYVATVDDAYLGKNYLGFNIEGISTPQLYAYCQDKRKTYIDTIVFLYYNLGIIQEIGKRLATKGYVDSNNFQFYDNIGCSKRLLTRFRSFLFDSNIDTIVNRLELLRFLKSCYLFEEKMKFEGISLSNILTSSKTLNLYYSSILNGDINRYRFFILNDVDVKSEISKKLVNKKAKHIIDCVKDLNSKSA